MLVPLSRTNNTGMPVWRDFRCHGVHGTHHCALTTHESVVRQLYERVSRHSSFFPVRGAGSVPNGHIDPLTPQSANHPIIMVLGGERHASTPPLATTEIRLYFQVVAICCPLTALRVSRAYRICEKKLVQCPLRNGNSIADSPVRMFTRYSGGVYGGGSAEEGLVF